MKIKLLHAVLHDGHRVEAGQTGEIEETLAEKLIASGAAVTVEEPAPANDAGNAAPKEPLLQPDAGRPAPVEAKTEAASAAETKTAESEPTKKADKAKAEGK